MEKFKSLLIAKDEEKIIFSGYFMEKFFFETKERGKIEVINDYLFYKFEIEYITNYLKENLLNKL